MIIFDSIMAWLGKESFTGVDSSIQGEMLMCGPIKTPYRPIPLVQRTTQPPVRLPMEKWFQQHGINNAIHENLSNPAFSASNNPQR